MKRVNFTDKQIPALTDMNNISINVLDNIQEMIKSFLKKKNTILKGLQVTASSPAAMSVKVLVDPTDSYGLAVDEDGKFIKMATDQTVAIAAAHGSLSRIDIVSIAEDWIASDNDTRYIRTNSTTIIQQLVDTTYTRTYSLVATEGVAGSGVAPATPAGYVKLAEVTVDPGATSIVSGKIKDATVASTWTTEASSTNYQIMNGNIQVYEDSNGDFVVDHSDTIVLRVTDAGTVTYVTLNATTVNCTSVNATTGNFTQGIGIFPVGGVVGVFSGMTGFPGLSHSFGWALCNGTTALSQGMTSSVITGILPNLNNGAFIRGATSSWTSGGASGGADTHTHNIGTYASGLSGTGNTSPATGNTGSTTPGVTGEPSNNTSGSTSVTLASGGSHSHAVSLPSLALDDTTLYFSTTISTGANALFQRRVSAADVVSSTKACITATVTSAGSHTHENNAHTHTLSSHTHASAAHTHTLNNHMHTGPSHSHSLSGASESSSTLPVYFNVVYYMRCK